MSADLRLDLTDSSAFVAGVPHDHFTYLRHHDPVHWHPERDGPGFWVITRHEDVTKVSKDWQTYSSNRGATYLHDLPAEQLEQQRMMMLNMDPPQHTKLRLMVNKGFLPRHVNELESHVRAIATEIVDGVIERGSCDFVTDVAMELPLAVIAEMMGVPKEDRFRLFDWTNSMIGSEDPEYAVAPEAAGNAAIEMFMYANELAAAKRAKPGDDLISNLLSAEIDGENLSDLEFDLFFMLLAVAGNETTRNLVSHALLGLFEFPDQWAALVAAGATNPFAIEEFLRWGTPVMHFRRTAQHDEELHGKTICEGDKVTIWYASANRDETVIPDPDRFDVARTPNQHVAFGAGGPHFCLGANLARLEIRALFDEIIRRMPDVRQAGPAQRLRSNFINGIKHLPIEYTPAPRS